MLLKQLDSLRLDMLLHYSPQARYVKSAKDLSHIELERSDNISGLSKARIYRVGEVDISTEEKQEQEYKVFSLYSCSVSVVIRVWA